MRTYQSKNYLSIPKENCQITCIDDIGEVESVEVEEDRKMSEAVIVGIKFFDVYDGCYACRGKIVPSSDVLEDCSRCGMTQRLNGASKWHLLRWIWSQRVS